MTPHRGARPPKQRKRARCAAFEAHHRGIQAALAPITSYGGNLIATLDFFRDGAKYYKVTEKVDLAGLDPASVARLDFPVKLVLLKTVAHSLKILHDLDIVHSDLKPSNVLIKKTELGYTTKLIDFDSSYIVGSPPPPDDIVGTMNYYSPELVRYIQGTADGAELTEASDVFALGLIYSRIPHRGPAAVRPGVSRGGDRGPERRPATAPPGGRAATHRGTRGADAARRPGRPPHHRAGPRHPHGLAQRRAHQGGAAAPATPDDRAGRARQFTAGQGPAAGRHRTPSLPGTTPPAPPADCPGCRSLPVADSSPIPAPPTATDTAAGTGGGFGKLVGKLLGKLEERRSR